jgi:hypothetical protein
MSRSAIVPFSVARCEQFYASAAAVATATPYGEGVNSDRIIGLILALVGLAMCVGFVIWDINGAPSWLHFFSWIGGGLSGYGLVLLFGIGRRQRG